jgi:hypothetical protein
MSTRPTRSNGGPRSWVRRVDWVDVSGLVTTEGSLTEEIIVSMSVHAEPLDLFDAYSAFGMNSSRMLILGVLLDRQETPTSRVVSETTMSLNGVRSHLLELERCGLVVARHSTHPRGAGPITYWSADADAIADFLESIYSYLVR